MTKQITTYQIILSVGGETITLPMTSERKTRSVLVKAAFASRDLLISNLSASDLNAETAYRNGALCFGSALVHYRAA